jgi:hypothetical protein
VSECVKKQDPNMLSIGNYFKYKGTYILKINVCRKIYHTNTNQKKA